MSRIFTKSLVWVQTRYFAPVFMLLSLLLGALALTFMAREEEPQIVVPMLEVSVQVPNASSQQIARQVTRPLQKILAEVPGVEHLYASSYHQGAKVVMRFYVGEERQAALVNTYNTLMEHQASAPAMVQEWQLRSIEVDDVPIMMLGLVSHTPEVSDYELTRLAQELVVPLQQIDATSEITLTGGRTREIRIELDLAQLSARQVSVQDVLNTLKRNHVLAQVGVQIHGGKHLAIDVGDAYRTSHDLNNMVVATVNGIPVMLRDIANLVDAPEEPNSYQWYQDNTQPHAAMVTLAIAKQAGANAVTVANQVHEKMAQLKHTLFPHGVDYVTLRDYGKTADDKVSNLVSSLAFAVVTVVLFVGVFLGSRAAMVVGLAIPVCYGLTLALDWAFGYTINRVTLFALILSLGLLVDDPITGVDNISRFLQKKGERVKNITSAMLEVRTALLMSTLTIVLAFVPLAFITGMMGPYMAPMAFNVPVSVIISTLVAFLVTPWLANKLLKNPQTQTEQVAVPESTGYGRLMSTLLAEPKRAKTVLWFTLGLFVLSAALPVFRVIPLKLLPFDNKNEVQILIDMPEGTALEQTSALTKQIASQVAKVNEVVGMGAFVGVPSAMDFNGMVRGYYHRQGSHFAELRVLLKDKDQRSHQSHGVVLRLRDLLAPFNQAGVEVKVVEVPPGPPVLSTLVAEVYADEWVDNRTHQAAAKQVAARFKQEPFVTEVTTSISDPQTRWQFKVDQQKAALAGVSKADIAAVVRVALQGQEIGTLISEQDALPVAINLTVPFAKRHTLAYLNGLYVRGNMPAHLFAAQGVKRAERPLIPLSELGEWVSVPHSPRLDEKDLRPVIYVMAELNGRTPAEVISDISSDFKKPEFDEQTPWYTRTFVTPGGTAAWDLPAGTSMAFSGEGEWRITIRVFRDMGLAFAFALTAIFIVLSIQTRSKALAGIIMLAIPLSVIGIMPGFWLMNQFGERVIAGAPEPILFTATAMIGMIALAGIVVRNALILIEFINLRRQAGDAIQTAIVAAGVTRMRPVLLTAVTTLIGNLVITLDPVFSGLALAIIFGIIASTLFSLVVIPLVYFLVFAPRSKAPHLTHGESNE